MNILSEIRNLLLSTRKRLKFMYRIATFRNPRDAPREEKYEKEAKDGEGEDPA